MLDLLGIDRVVLVAPSIGAEECAERAVEDIGLLEVAAAIVTVDNVLGKSSLPVSLGRVRLCLFIA